jgi:ATP-dependent RNA helicase TDRD9
MRTNGSSGDMDVDADRSGSEAAAAASPAGPRPQSVAATTNLEGVSTVMASEPVNMINFSNFLSQQKGAAHDVAVKSLPIEAHKQEILRAIRMNQVTIIEGKTGCGKTTRVPVFIMEDMAEHSEQFHIVVTQPRRIAAVSVARRVAHSCNYELGNMVGYQIGLDRTHVTPDTHLLYCTTGVLLQKVLHMRKEGKLRLEYTHIIIDEIHERNVDTDLLLMILRQYVWEEDPKVKLILMSATFETERFADYFSVSSEDPVMTGLRPDIISIQQQPNKLSVFFLEEFEGKWDLPQKTDFHLDDPQILPELYDVCLRVIRNMTVIEAQKQRARGAVLIFLPGLNEITEFHQRLLKVNEDEPASKFYPLPLHSSITDDQQRLVFEKPPPGHRKIILATNIAESSITVPDIEYVIDFCLTKNLVMDKKTNLPTLMLEWATQASCKQRAGRAGRTCDGRAFHLVFSTFHRMFEKFPKPEILNIPLENCVLSAKVLDMGPPKKVLALCLDPPKIEDIRTAVLKLKRTGGLSVMNDAGVFDPEDGFLTAMGRIMKHLPIDINASKLIVLGYIFGLVEEAVVMAACLTANSMLARAFGQELESYKCRLVWADRSFCDLISYYNAYTQYQQFRVKCNADSAQLRQWAKSNFVQLKRIAEVEETVKDIQRRLDDAKLCRSKPPNLQIDPVERELVLKFMIAGAFYPNYFMRQQMDPTAVSRQLPGHDPHSSVILAGFPQHQGVLYAQRIKDLMRPASDVVDLDFEDSKVIVTFPSERNALSDWSERQADFLRTQDQLDDSFVVNQLRETVTKSAVYVAIKMRKLSRTYPLQIRLLNTDIARKKAEQLMYERDRKFDEQRLLRSSRFRVPAFTSYPFMKPVMPTRNLVQISITWMEDCGQFFAQYTDSDSVQTIRAIADAVANFAGHRIRTPTLGMLVLVALQNNQTVDYQRAVIVDLHADKQKVQVRKLDYGGRKWVTLDELVLIMPDDAPAELLLPAQAFECRLAEIKPSSFRNIHGVWEADATAYFDTIIRENSGKFMAEIFSILEDNVFRVRLMTTTTNELVNDLMLDAGWAETAEESHESVQNYEMRQRMAQCLSQISKDISQLYNVNLCDVEIEENRMKKVELLKGPNSPLECSFAGVAQNQYAVGITIDPRSVNSVALESDPYCTYQRMLVSAISTYSNESKKVVARETCMMPVIPGLPGLICLTFAPVCELRCDNDNTLFLGVLCGLGAQLYEGHLFPYDKEHDIEMPFDVVFTRNDIIDINLIRYRISSMLSEHMTGRFELAGTPLFNRQKQLRSQIVTLMHRRRMKLPPVPVTSRPHFNFRWGLNPTVETAAPALKLENKSLFLQMIPIPQIGDFLRRADEELSMFRNLTQADFDERSYVCMLDNTIMRTYGQLEEHLKSKDHVKRCQELIYHRHDEQMAQETQPKDKSGAEVRRNGNQRCAAQFSSAPQSEDQPEDMDQS